VTHCKVCQCELIASEKTEGICYSCSLKSLKEQQAIIDNREKKVNSVPSEPAEKQKTVVKTYTGKQTEATKLYEEDAVRMSEDGYFPVSQSYHPGTWGCGAFIIAVLAGFLIIGIIALIYMLIVKPAGTLTVTYEFREERFHSSKKQSADNLEPKSKEKICPQCAESVKAAARICRYCRHDFTGS